jgi:hypothetical protein
MERFFYLVKSNIVIGFLRKNGMAKIPPLEMYLPGYVLASVVHTAGPGCAIIHASQNLQSTKTYIYIYIERVKGTP